MQITTAPPNTQLSKEVFMLKKFAVVLPTLAVALSPFAAFAGEVGVSNKYTDGWSYGNSHINISSYEVRKGFEASFAYADKDYSNIKFDQSGFSFEDVNATSGYLSAGTYLVENKANGYTSSHFGNTSHEHRTTAFTNF
ncbi:hypothetical protein [Chroogloeocystis siderophila]|uniref:Uncharacterized protein n=2 Tax=Chroogloeocystis TaxID=329162 RepID=A0A1U7HFD8_9CHRO|nr:hypothetical protein NIES1031_20505 [Chroogloeocystis siderophila 5.2 s.c.1]